MGRSTVRVEAKFKSRRFFMPGMSIGEVARKMGLRSSAIRYYERLGLIPKAPRLGGRRRYDDRVLERLAMVRFAKHVGFSIAEIKVLLAGVDRRRRPSVGASSPPRKSRKSMHSLCRPETSEKCCPKRSTSSVRDWWSAVVPCPPQPHVRPCA
jgi:DNA-binding transcriptional MerR regulator